MKRISSYSFILLSAILLLSTTFNPVTHGGEGVLAYAEPQRMCKY